MQPKTYRSDVYVAHPNTSCDNMANAEHTVTLSNTLQSERKWQIWGNHWIYEIDSLGSSQWHKRELGGSFVPRNEIMIWTHPTSPPNNGLLQCPHQVRQSPWSTKGQTSVPESCIVLGRNLRCTRSRTRRTVLASTLSVPLRTECRKSEGQRDILDILQILLS